MIILLTNTLINKSYGKEDEDNIAMVERIKEKEMKL